MKEQDTVFQFNKAHACVIFKNERSAATGRKMPKLYVQVIDQYRYQREWTLQFRHEPGDSKKLYWESSVYHHPGRREVVRLGKAQAEKCIKKFLSMCQNYPELLFNEEGDRPRCEGFVHFAELLHRGALPSATML